MHHPAQVKRLSTQKLDLIMAGHSHGGKAGPLYVNAGIGYIGKNNFRLAQLLFFPVRGTVLAQLPPGNHAH